MKKVKLHPFFLLLIAMLIFMGKWVALSTGILAVILHEYAHLIAARMRGYRLFQLTLMPYGAVLSTDENIKVSDETFIFIAGPLANFAIATIIVAFWWIKPASFAYTLDFYRANIAIGLFNLLPAYPLDGARLLLGVAKNRKRMLSILKLVGVLLSFAFMAGFVISAFFKINFTLGIASIMLFVGSMVETKKERYMHLCRQISYLKDFSHPIEKKYITINANVAISRLVRMLKPYAVYEIDVVDNAMKKIATIKEEDFERVIMTEDSNKPIGEVVSKLFDKID